MTEGIRDLGEDFDAFVAQGLSLVDFWAGWCGPCRSLDPVLEALAHDVPDVHWGKVEITQQPDLAARFAVRTVPTLIAFRDGEPIKTLIGVKNRKQILRALDREESASPAVEA